MEGFFQAAGAVVILVILCLLVSSRDKSFASLLVMGGCAMVLMLGISYLSPVVSFLQDLQSLGNLQPELVKILMKVTGIGILTEITVLLCADSGNSSLGQSLRILSTGVILWLSLPIFQAMLDLVQSILEGL